MSPSIIGLILGILAILIVVLPTIMGAVRGLKKSTFRFVWVVVWAFVCFFLAQVIAKSLVNVDISFLNLSVDGQAVNTLPEYFIKLLETSNSDVAHVISDNPQVLDLVTTMVALGLSLVVFELLFWLTKWILWPIWAILSAIFFKNKKVIKTQKRVVNENITIPEKQETVKINKHSGFGALVGLAMGIVVLIFTFIPIAGINNVALELERVTQTEQEDGTTKGIITQNLQDDGYLYCYENSAVKKVLKYTGVDAISGAFASALTTTNFQGEKINLKNEITYYGSIYTDYDTVQKTDFGNITQEQMNELLPVIQNMSDKVLASGIVASLYNQLAPYLIDNMLSNPDYFIKLPDLNNDILNAALRAYLVEVKDISASELRSDVPHLINVAKQLNDVGLLVPIIKNDLKLKYVQDNISKNLANGINDDLMSMKTVSKLLPIAISSGIEYGCQQIDVEYVKSDEKLTNEEFKNFFGNLLSDAVDIVKGIDEDLDLKLSTQCFKSVGDVLDSVKNSKLLTSQTYQNLVDYATDKANAEVDKMKLDDEFKTIAKSLIRSVGTIPSFKTELENLGNAYQNFLNYNTENGTKNDIDAKTAFDILDNIKTCHIYQSNLDAIIENANNFAVRYVAENDLPLETTNFKTILEKLKLVISFSNEFNAMNDTIEFVKKLSKSSNMSDEIMKEENLKALGKNLDNAIAKGSVLLGKENCQLAIQAVVAKVELPNDIKDVSVNGKPIVEALKENVNKISSFESELSIVSKLLDLDTSNLAQTGKTLDEVKTSALLDGVISPVVAYVIDKKANELTDQDVKNIVLKIKDNVDAIESYETEFGYMDKLLGIDFDNTGLSQIGKTLDEVKNSKLIGGAIDDIIILETDRETEKYDDEDVKAIVEKAKKNIDQIESYEAEFEYLQKFVDLDFDTATLAEFGTLLDSLTQSKLFQNVTNDILSVALDNAEGNISNSTDYTEILTDLKANVENITPQNPLYDSTIYSKETTALQSLVNFANNGETKTIATLKNYLQTNIVNSNQISQSILFGENVLKDIAKLGVDKVKKDVDIAELDQAFVEIRATIPSAQNFMVIDALDNLNEIGTKVKSATNVKVDSSLSKEKVGELGATLDSLKQSKYQNVINANAITIIGNYAFKTLNTEIQNSAFVSAKKSQANDVYNTLTKTSDPVYSDFANQLANILFD